MKNKLSFWCSVNIVGYLNLEMHQIKYVIINWVKLLWLMSVSVLYLIVIFVFA